MTESQKIKNIKYITLEETKHILEQRINEGQITYAQQTSLDYAKKYSKVDLQQVKELRAQLSEILSDEFTIVRIIDMLPVFDETLNAITQKNDITLTNEQKNKILELCKEYRKKSKLNKTDNVRNDNE
ncbi:MAG: hypothetical protein QW474_03120 [Candidatus Aenigmatarchaeota archaeon]